MLTSKRTIAVVAVLFAMLVSGFFITSDTSDADEIPGIPIVYGSDVGTEFNIIGDAIYQNGVPTEYTVDSDGKILDGNGDDTGFYVLDGKITSDSLRYGSSDVDNPTERYRTITNPYELYSDEWGGTAEGSAEGIEIVSGSQTGGCHVVDLRSPSGDDIAWGVWFEGTGTYSFIIKYHDTGGIFGLGAGDNYDRYTYTVTDERERIGSAKYPLAGYYGYYNDISLNASEAIGRHVYITNNTSLSIIGDKDATEPNISYNVNLPIGSVNDPDPSGTLVFSLSTSNTSSSAFGTTLKKVSGSINCTNAQKNIDIPITIESKGVDGTSTQTYNGGIVHVHIINASSQVTVQQFNVGSTRTYEVAGNEKFYLPTMAEYLSTDHTRYMDYWISGTDKLAAGTVIGVTQDAVYSPHYVMMPISSYNAPSVSGYHEGASRIINPSSYSYDGSTYGTYTYTFTQSNNSHVADLYEEYINRGYEIELVGASWLNIRSISNSSVTISGTPTAPGIYYFELNIVKTSGSSRTTECGDYFVIYVLPPSDIQYTVTINPEGGTSNVTSPTKYGGECIELWGKNDVTKTNYVLGGWKLHINGQSEVQMPIGSIFTVYNSGSVTAVWKNSPVVLVFDANGGMIGNSNNNVWVKLAESNIEIPLMSADTFSKLGSTMLGWYLDTNPDIIYSPDYVYIPSNSTEIHYFKAYYVADSNMASTRTVSFDAGEGEHDSNSVQPESVRVESGKKVALPYSGFILQGYHLSGWKVGSTSVIKEPGTVSDTITTNMTFTAQYSGDTVTLYFNGNGGSVSILSMEVNNNDTFQPYLSSFPTPEPPTGYTWDGHWYFDPTDASTLITGGTQISSASGSITIFPHYTANPYTIRLHPTGGTVSSNSIPISYNSMYYLPTPSYDDSHFFAGWYTSENAGTRWADQGIYNVQGDTDLYAHWTDTGYTINLDYNGGAADGGITEFKIGDGMTYPELPTPTKENYFFSGWYNGNKRINLGSTFNASTDSRTITAHWTDVKVTVHLMFNGGSYQGETIKTIQVPENSIYPLDMPTPIRSGYIFQGYWTDSISGTRVNPGDLLITNSNHTLYAHWDIDSSSVDPGDESIYSVTFINLDNIRPSSAYNVKQVQAGSTISRPEAPISTNGKVFTNWYHGSAPFDFSTPIMGNTIIKAEWATLFTITPMDGNKVKVTIDDNYYGYSSIKWKSDDTFCRPFSDKSITHEYSDSDNEVVITVKVEKAGTEYEADLHYNVKEKSVVTNLKAVAKYSINDGKMTFDGSESRGSIIQYLWYKEGKYLAEGMRITNLDAPTETTTYTLRVVGISETDSNSVNFTIEVDDGNPLTSNGISIAVVLAVGLAALVGGAFLARRLL